MYMYFYCQKKHYYLWRAYSANIHDDDKILGGRLQCPIQPSQGYIYLIMPDNFIHIFLFKHLYMIAPHLICRVLEAHGFGELIAKGPHLSAPYILCPWVSYSTPTVALSTNLHITQKPLV